MKQQLFQGLGYHVPDRELSLPPCIADYFMGAVEKALEASSLVRIHSTPSIYEKKHVFCLHSAPNCQTSPQTQFFPGGLLFYDQTLSQNEAKAVSGAWISCSASNYPSLPA